MNLWNIVMNGIGLRDTLLARSVCVVALLICWPVQGAQFDRVDSIQHGPAALSQFVSQHPEKLAVVLVSTPGCGFCDLVRHQQLAPLLRDPEFPNVSVFEIMMRDTDQFSPMLARLDALDGSEHTNLETPADLSRQLGLRMAPTVLFLGDGRELSERLIGYSSPDFYFAYLAERIESAAQKLANTTH